MGGIVVGTANVDALRRADAGAQFATDALLHPVLVPVEHVTAMEAFGFGDLLVAGHVLRGVTELLGPTTPRVLGGDTLAAEQAVLADGDGEPVEVAHQPRCPITTSLPVIRWRGAPG